MPLGFVVLVAIVSSAMAAEDVTFTVRVPVELTELHPEVEKVRVTCWLGETEANAQNWNRSWHPRQAPLIPVDRNKGTASAIAEVKIDVPQNLSHKVAAYYCWLTFFQAGGGNRDAVLHRDYKGPNADKPHLLWWVVKDGTVSMVGRVRGTTPKEEIRRQ